MAEIAAAVAVVVALVALWMGSTAHRHTESTFTKYSNALNKQVRDAQAEIAIHAEKLSKDMKELSSELSMQEMHSTEHSEKINTLIQRVKVLEHDLKSLSDAIPPQYRRTPPRRAGDGMM